MDPSLSSLPPSAPLPPQNPKSTSSPVALSAAITLLGDLIALAESSLTPISDFSSLSPSFADDFSRCPYNSHHRMPPEFLFRHCLLCAAAPGAPFLGLEFLDDLRYPGSLKSASEHRKENTFVQSLPVTDADLCFSLDSQLRDVGSNFFYKDCPSVVTITTHPDVSTETFTLPGMLSTECANFVCDHEEQSCASGGGGIQILPSEYWTLRCEVEAWSDLPITYSYTVLRVMSTLALVEEDGLKRWVIANSPRFGVVIDVSMRDHIYLLLKLCLKAIEREACSSVKLILNKQGIVDTKITFQCPRLVKSFNWLVTQMSILYGEVNGRLFTTGMLKESVLRASSGLLKTRLGGQKLQMDDCTNVNVAYVSDMRCDTNTLHSSEDMKLEDISKEVSSTKVFVSQVAAAVAALHEKSLLQERIRYLRFAQPLSKSQILLEHSHTLARGCEERGKRPNYRPVLEHDGLLLHRVQTQDIGKANKTKEELLAEERDYKRRRMSYRGKKVKRNPTEVIRDIIEEHMEEIKEAAGVDQNVKFAADASVLPTKQPQNEAVSDIYRSNSNDFDLSAVGKYTLPCRSHGDSYRSHSSNVKSCSRLRHDDYEDRKERDRNTNKRRQNSGRSSSSTHISTAPYQYTPERGHDYVVSRGSEYRSDTINFSRLRDNTSQSPSITKSFSDKQYTYISRDSSKDTVRAFENISSESVMQAFEDRYNPSTSSDDYDATFADVSAGNSYSSSYKFCNPKYDDKNHFERQGHHSSSRRHGKDYK